MAISVSADMCKWVTFMKDNSPTILSPWNLQKQQPSQRRWIKRRRWSPISLTSHEFSDSLLTWGPRYRANENNLISAQAQPTLPSLSQSFIERHDYIQVCNHSLHPITCNSEITGYSLKPSHYSETSKMKNLIMHQTNTGKLICYQLQSAI